MQEEPDNRTRRMSRFADLPPLEEPETLTPAQWFTRAPYPGVWISLGLTAVLATLVAAPLVRSHSREPQPTQVVVAPAPPPTVVAPQTDAPTAVPPPVPPPDEQPSVDVKTLPGSNAPRPITAPFGAGAFSTNAPAPETAPRATAPAPVRAAPTPPSVIPDLNGGRISQPERQPEVDVPAPAPEAAPEVRPAPRRVIIPPPAPAPEPARRPTGLLTIYFDADSSTFAHGDERMPLRVEVYVDGVRRLVTDDPEKREFRVGQLPEGRHTVRIVPHVADYPPTPYEQTVEINAGEVTDYKAVLRKSHDVSVISKFKRRD